MYTSITALWCNRSHYNAEVIAAADPQAALLQILDTRQRFSFCHGGKGVELGRLVVRVVVQGVSSPYARRMRTCTAIDPET